MNIGPPPPRLRAIHIEDDPLWGGVVARVINDLPTAAHVGSASNASDGIKLCHDTTPDVAIIDLGLPDGDGFKLAACLRATVRPPRIVLLTVRSDDVTLFRAWSEEIDGLIWKSVRCPADLRAMFAAMSAGRRFFPAEVLAAMNRFRSSPEAFFKILSPREQNLIEALVSGDSNEEIAKVTGLSHHTVQTHRKRIMAKLNLHTTRDLARWGRERGFNAVAPRMSA